MLMSDSYLGLGTVVIESYPQPRVELTYVKQSGESNGDAGDQYTGLDRFGRVVDQCWIVTSTGAATNRFQYGCDQDSNVLYRNNLVNTSFGELYHANGSGNGYDNLNRLTNFARGVLSASGSTLDTITSPSHSQSWSLDALGNCDRQKGSGVFSDNAVSYATTPYIGTQNTNYYTTLTDYGSRGRQTRVQVSRAKF